MRHRVQDGTFDAEQRFGGQGEEHEHEQCDPDTMFLKPGSRTRHRSSIAVASMSEPTGDGGQRQKNAKRLAT